MTFLVPYVTDSDRPASSNLSQISDLELSVIDTASRSSTEAPSIQSPVPEEDVTASTFEKPLELDEHNTPVTSKRRFSRATRKRSAPIDIDQEILNTLKTIPTTPYVPPQDEDEDLLFFKSMIPKIKTLDDIQKMELQAEMHSVLLKHLRKARATTAGDPTSSATRSREQEMHPEEFQYNNQYYQYQYS